jgi:prepilin-type N-terminal cleavage/methylation domain-containing protein
MTRSRSKNRPPRSGFTLIELAVVVTLTSVVLTLSAATIITLFRVERQFAGDAAQDFALARLASHWRADAHQATTAKMDAGCELILPGGRTIRYTFASPAVIREVRRGDQLEHRDAFVLTRRSVAEFSVEPSGDGKIVQLMVEPAQIPERAHSTPVRPLTIAAAVDLYGQAPRAEDRP